MSARFPLAVVLLGVTSLLADVSSEMLFAVLPFFVASAGGGGLAIGLVSGLGDAVSEVVKLGGGWASDRLGRRKPLVVAGYGVAALGKLGIAVASHWGAIVGFRAFERTGKGIRTAPRDALLAEVVAPERRGAAFGLHRAMDTAGAVVGVAVALALVLVAGWGYFPIVVAASVVGAVAIVPLLFVREPRGVPVERKGLRVALGGLPAEYRRYLATSVLFGASNVSVLFFTLHGGTVLRPEAPLVPGMLLYLAFNVVYAATSYPAGHVSDRVGRARVLVAGYALFAASCAVFAIARGWVVVGALLALGAAYGLVQGPTRALAVDRAAGAAKGTALGTFYAVVGLATFVGGVVAGLAWDAFGPWATFAFASALAVVALAHGLLSGSLRPSPSPAPSP